MLKDIKRIFKVMVGCVVIVVSPYICANTMNIPIELECSKNLMMAPWHVFGGKPGIQYSLTTEGLRDVGKDGIVKIVDVNSLGRTLYGLHVSVVAKCIPLDEEADMSLTGSHLACNDGEGIKIKMFEPNGDPDKYHYVGTLTITVDEKGKEEKKQKELNDVTTVFGSKEELLKTKIESTKSKVKENCRFINNFSSF